MRQKLLSSFRLRVVMLVAILCSAFTGLTWADEVLVYTLTPASGSNNGYANNCDIEINDITWNLTGNSTSQPWRIGGKSLTNTDRALYSKTAMSDNISKIEVTHGAASSITVNSWKVVVSKNSDFSNPVSTLTPTFEANKTTTITKPSGVDWSNCYFKFIYNVSVSGNTNRYIAFSEAKFYKETGTTLSPSDLALPGAPVALNFDLYNNASAQTVSFETSSTGTVTVSGGTGYVTTSVSGNTITVTPTAVTPSAQTITVNQAADNSYEAGSVTFTVSVANSTPQYNVTYKANGGTGNDVVDTYYQGETVTVAACSFILSGYAFTKWNTQADGNGTDYSPNATISNISANIDLFAQWEESNEVVDVLDHDFAGVSGTSYTEWSDTGTSGAVYAGQSAGGSNDSGECIQLRSSNNNSGIVTTTSGGLAKKVAVTWNSYTPNNRTLNVYGKSSAYSAVTDLYSSNTQGTLIGTIVKGTNTELTISDDYEFIGIRSDNNAIYLNEIRITWEPASTSKVATPTISGTENFVTSTEVSITCTTSGATIQYSIDNGSTWTNYSDPFTLTATTTVKAKAIMNGMDDSETAEQTFTKVIPMTVVEALAASASTGVYVQGIVCEVVSTSVNNNGQIRYYISDDGNNTTKLNVYNGKGLDGANFTSIDDIQIGDQVVIYGDISEYQGTNQINAGNYLVSQITKADPELSYTTTEYTVNLGESFTAPTLTNPHNLTVAYSVSTNDNVASVDTSTGAVTVGSNAGTVTITASFAANDTYRAGSASYTLTVKEPNFITLAAGATVTTTSFPSFSGSGYKTLDDYQIVLSSGEPKNWSVTDCMKSGYDLQMKASSGTLVSPDIRTPYGYTVSVNYTSDAAMTLSFGTDSETGSNGSVTLDVQSTEAAFTLNTGNKFATVQSISITAKSPTTATITLNAACHDNSGMVYGTYSNTSAFVVSDDIVVAEIGIDDNNKLVVSAYDTGDIVPANTGVMVSALNDDVAFANGTCDFTVTLSSETGTSVLGDGNRLRPTGDAGITAEAMAAAPANCMYYRLTMHGASNENEGTIGFWWGAEDGAAFGVAANKAYLAVPTAQAARITGFAFDDDNTTTAIESVMYEAKGNAAYNLNGQRVNANKKGIVIVNGKKMVNK